MEARKERIENDKLKNTALGTAQGHYLSSKYNNIVKDDSVKLSRYFYKFAKHYYPSSRNWLHKLYDRTPMAIGKLTHRLFKTKNEPGHIAASKQYIEQQIDRAIAAGCQQVFILNAGLDVTALIKSHEYPDVAFFEMDRGPQRLMKQNALMALRNGLIQRRELQKDLEDIKKYGIAEGNLVFIEGDVSDKLWMASLRRAGFDPKKNSIVICDKLANHKSVDELKTFFLDLQHLLSSHSRVILSLDERAQKKLSRENISPFLFELGLNIQHQLSHETIQHALGLSDNNLGQARKLQENYFLATVKQPGEELKNIEDIPCIDICHASDVEPAQRVANGANQ